MAATPADTREVFVFTREQARALDAAALSELGLPGIVLMENAGISLARTAMDLVARRGLRRVAICCGRGNNGGDGLAMARHLVIRGVDPLVLTVAIPEAYTGDAGINMKAVEASGITLIDPVLAMSPQAALETLLESREGGLNFDEARHVLIVDALLGTGLDRAPVFPYDRVIGWMNAMRGRGATVLAVDVPSGLDCDTGLPLGQACVSADVTLTLAGPKVGLLQPDAAAYTGQLVIGDIGVPPSLLRKFGKPLLRVKALHPGQGQTDAA